MRTLTILKIKYVCFAVIVAILSLLVAYYGTPALMDVYSNSYNDFANSKTAIELAKEMSTPGKISFSIFMGFLELIVIALFLACISSFVYLAWEYLNSNLYRAINDFIIKSFLEDKLIIYKNKKISKVNKWVLNVKEQTFEILDNDLKTLKKIDVIDIATEKFKIQN